METMVWRFHWVLALSFCTVEAVRDYIANGSFVPSTFDIVLLPGVRPVSFGARHGDRAVDAQRWAFARFNPSVAILPARVKQDLERVQLNRARGPMTTRRPTYVASFRHSNAMCNELVSTGLPPASHRKHRFIQTTLAILDEDMTIMHKVASAARPGEAWDCEREDVRLETRPAFGDRILATAMHYIPPDWRDTFEVFWLALDVTDRGVVTVDKRPLEHPDISVGIIPHARNLGVLWDGAAGPFSLIHWLGDATVDVRRGIPPPEPWSSKTPSRVALRATKSVAKKALHNSGNPVDLDPWCPGLLAAVGHYHLDKMPPGTTRWGDTYVQHILVFEARPPYSHVATSAGFCFPALNDSSRCEILQFVSGFLVLDNATVVLTYGINDCESARVQVHLGALLDFVDPRLLSSGLCRVSSKASYIQIP